MFEQHLIDGTDGLVRKVARQFDVPDLGAEPGRTLDDVGARNDVVDGCRVAHGRALVTAIPWTKLRHAPVAETTAEIDEIISG
ncbi:MULTISPECIES: hypothetical protein [unclassified Bradyrhizobium]|uniref:hypothetical protein n=1 Tax=unclassified Bradyrhizobium TaxID=2631580 RepID=UPI003399ECFC